jgi:hypothetical protein
MKGAFLPEKDTGRLDSLITLANSLILFLPTVPLFVTTFETVFFSTVTSQLDPLSRWPSSFTVLPCVAS